MAFIQIYLLEVLKINSLLLGISVHTLSVKYFRNFIWNLSTKEFEVMRNRIRK